MGGTEREGREGEGGRGERGRERGGGSLVNPQIAKATKVEGENRHRGEAENREAFTRSVFPVIGC
jgi:hypothetical protein